MRWAFRCRSHALKLGAQPVHDPPVHNLEALVHVFDSKLVGHVKEFPGKEMDDDVAQPFSTFQCHQVFFVKRQPVILLDRDVPDVTNKVICSPRCQFKVEPQPHVCNLIRCGIRKKSSTSSMSSANDWFLPAFFRGTFIVSWTFLYLHRSPQRSKKILSSGWRPAFLGSFIVLVIAVLALAILALFFLGGVALVLDLAFLGGVGFD
jgi:hypothetical protein